MTSRPWVVRALVILTALLCLGLAGYAGQVWWARGFAAWFASDPGYSWKWLRRPCLDGSYFRAWRGQPRWGNWNRFSYSVTPGGTVAGGWRGSWRGEWKGYWVPRRAYRELLCRVCGEDLGDEPSVWEAWFQTHPDLIWDERLQRLVDSPPATR